MSDPALAAPRALTAARSLLFAIGLGLSTVIFFLLLVPTALFPLPHRYRVGRWWNRTNIWWLGLTCGLRHRAEGLENIPDTPTIVMAKHQSAWETIALALWFSPTIYVLKRELLRLPFFGWAIALMGPIAIDRQAGRNAIRQLVDQGRDRLARGCWVVVFPEGTRVAAGQRGRYRAGGAALASATGMPVVPVAHDAGRFWPRNSFLKFPGTVRVVIGPPIVTAGRAPAAINRDVETWIETTMERIGCPAREVAKSAPERASP